MRPAKWTWKDELATLGAVLACELLVLAGVAAVLWGLVDVAGKALGAGR